MSKPKPTKTESPLALAIPASVQPKPRKEDIINALVERAREKHIEESKALNEKRRLACDAFNTAVIAHFWANASKWANFVSLNTWNDGLEITFRTKDVPVKIKALRKAANEIPRLRGFDAIQVKRCIREAMAENKGTAVQALLCNPEMVKKLDQTLEAIGA